MSVKEKMTAIADTIRLYTGGTEKLRLDDMPREIKNACGRSYENGYDAGQTSGGEGSYESGFEDGKTQGKLEEQERFWQAYLGNATPLFGTYMFSGYGWTDETYAPTERLVFYSCISGFHYAKITDTKVDIELVANTNATNMFNTCLDLKTIRKLVLAETVNLSGAFNYCNALENITVEGTIGRSADLHWSTKLTKSSIESIVTALSDAAIGQTLTLSQTAVDTAFYDYDNEMFGYDTPEWNELVESKPNWTISLV